MYQAERRRLPTTTRMKKNPSHILSYLGLSEDAAKTYLACLKLGKAKASDIAKEADFPRTAVYTYLDELEELGLMQVSIEEHAKMYIPSNPGIISSLMKQQVGEMDSLLPTLLATFSEKAPQRPTLRFYAGYAGIQEVMEEILNCASKYYNLFGSIHDNQLVASHGNYLIDWSKRRIERGVDHKNLRSREPWRELAKKQDQLMSGSGKHVLREIRYAPNGIRFPVLIYLFDDKVALVSGALGKQYAAVLESKDMYEGLSSVFHFLWGVSTPPEEVEKESKISEK